MRCSTVASLHQLNLYGKSETPCKMTYSRMAFVERGLRDKRAHSNKHARAHSAHLQVERQQAQDGTMAGPHTHTQRNPLKLQAIATVAEELEEVGIHTLGARTRAVQL